MQRGFSLVELSIVLVILGLLTGGILAGQSLIRAAELRSISTDVNRFVTASQTFRDKYFALPGDMANAEKFWGTDSVSCPNGGGATGVCNGDGSGTIGIVNFSPAQYCENQEFWRHLARAGLMEGTYTPNTAANCYAAVVAGQQVPRLRVANSGVTMTFIAPVTASGAYPGNAYYPGSYGNTFIIGTVPGVVNHLTNGPFLKPEEAWNIDTKMDDGRPGLGNVMTFIPGAYSANCAETVPIARPPRRPITASRPAARPAT